MRPRPAGPSPRAPRSPGARARASAPSGPRPTVLRRIPKACGPPPGRASPLPGAPGPAGAPRYRSIFLAATILACCRRTPRPAVPDWPSLTLPRSWRRPSGAGPPSLPPAAGGGGARSSHLSRAGGVRPAEPSGSPALSAPLPTHRLPAGAASGPYRNMATS